MAIGIYCKRNRVHGAEKKAFDYLDAPVVRIMGGDVPLPYAPTLIEAYLPILKELLRLSRKW